MAAIVQTKTVSASNASSVDAVFDSNVTNGNLIVFVVGVDPGQETWVAGDLAKQAGTATIGTIALDVQEYVGSDYSVAIWSIPVTGTGSLTLRLSCAAGSTPYVSTIEVSGADVSGSRLYGTNQNRDQAVGTLNSGTVATTGGGIFVGAGNMAGGTSYVIKSGWTSIESVQVGIGYRIVSGATTDSASWTEPTGNINCCIVAAYKDGAGGGSIVPQAMAQYINQVIQ
jgi:hypothetical protein